MKPKTKEQQIKELSDHILGMYDCLENQLNLIRRLNNCDSFYPFKKIIDNAYKLKKENDQLWKDKILVSSSEEDVNTLFFKPDPLVTYNSLVSLSLSTNEFINLVLSETKYMEELTEDALNN